MTVTQPTQPHLDATTKMIMISFLIPCFLFILVPDHTRLQTFTAKRLDSNFTMSNTVQINTASDPTPGEIASLLWGQQPKSKKAADLEAVAHFYQREWANYRSGEGSNSSLSFNDFRSAVELVKAGRTCEEIMAKLEEVHESTTSTATSAAPSTALPATPPTKEALEALVDLAARAVTMVSVGGSPELAWTGGSLQQLLAAKLPQTPTLVCEKTALPKTFHGFSVENGAKITVEFTDNLADHLLLVNDGAGVLVFHHVSFLECQEKSRCVTPSQFIHLIPHKLNQTNI